MKEHNGTTSASAPTPSGRRQSIAPQQQPAIIPQGSLSMRPNFQTLTHPQTSLQQTNINHTGLMIQRPIAPGMQQVGPGMLPLQEQPQMLARGIYPTSRQSAPVGTTVSPRMSRQPPAPALKQSTQSSPIMPTAGVPTFQNVSGQQLPISPSSRVPGIRQSPQTPFYSSQMYPPLVDQTSNYRSVPGTNASVRPPSMSSGRMSLPPQSGHQSSVNMATIPHSYNPPVHHTSQQSNPSMLPPQSMQPHPSPRLSSSHSDLQSASARTTRPQLANPMVVHDTRPSSTSTLTQGLTQGVQQLSLRSSIQETPSKMTSIPHAALRPTEGQRSMQESGPQAMQGIQPISHTSSRTSSQSYVSDAPPPLISQSVQLATNIRSNPKLLPQHAPIQPAQRINNQKPSSPIISQTSVKTTQASPKPMHSSTKPSHRSHKNGHHNSQKSIHQPTQLTASQQASQRAEITEAAQVLYLSSMSVRSREDPHRYMNSGLNSQYATMGNIHINPGEGSHYIHHRNRYAGPMSLDNSMTRGMNDESIPREQDIGLVPHNRGHKMKHRAEALDSGVKLRAPYGYVEDKEEIEIPNGTRRPIIYRGSKEATDQATEFVGEANDSPYKDIDVENILGPLEKPEDAVRKPHYRRILKSKHLESLANELMERIEREHEFNKKISRLMIVLQGDDDMHQELDFRLNPPPETVSTRVFKAEEVEGGKNFGVLNVGLQGNDRSKGKRAQEAKDQGLENLIMVREQLQEQLENSNEILRRYNETREGILKAIRQRNMIYRRLCEIDKQRRKEEKNNDKTSTPLKKHLLKDKEKEREKEKEKEREV